MLVLENTTGADVAEKLNVRSVKIRFALISLYPNKNLTPKPLSKIGADGLGVSFFGLYSQLCENGGVCGSQILYCILHH